MSSLSSGRGCAARWCPLAAMVAVVGLSVPALAAYTNLNGTVTTSGGGTHQQSFPDDPNASLSGLQSQDGLGNDAVGNGTMSALAGYFTASTQARSGGQIGWGGQSNAEAHADVTLDYRVDSATLAPGTPVQLQVRWAVNGNETATGLLTYWAYGSLGGLDAQVSITVAGVTIVNKSGSRRREYNITNGYTHTTSGALNVEDDHGDHTVTALVGQQLRIFMSGTSSGVTIAGGSDVADGDSQMAMSWGVTSLDPQATIVSLTHPGQSAPPAANATPEQNLARLPPRPPNLPQCFTIPTQPVAASRCLSTSVDFSVAAAGTGPFTYLWRKGGVLLDTAANPSAATAMLSLASISASDAGSYDCLITNPCGGASSDAVALTVFGGVPGDVNGDGLVDGVDVQAFVGVIGSNGPPSQSFCGADLDGSGIVDAADVPPLVALLLVP